MRARLAVAGLALVAGLAACSSHDDTGGVSADDQRALNDAAAMLDANNAVPAQSPAQTPPDQTPSDQPPSEQGNAQ